MSLRCHQEDCQLTFAVDTLDTIPDALEALLCSAAVPWKPYATYRKKPPVKTK